MTTSESNGRFFYKKNRFESIRVTNRIESIRIANWNALPAASWRELGADLAAQLGAGECSFDARTDPVVRPALGRRPSAGPDQQLAGAPVISPPGAPRTHATLIYAPPLIVPRQQQIRRPSVRASKGWWRGTVVERRSLAGELSLSCARPAADG